MCKKCGVDGRRYTLKIYIISFIIQGILQPISDLLHLSLLLVFLGQPCSERHFNIAQPFRGTLGAHSKCPFVVPSEHKAIKNQLASPKKMQSTRTYAYASVCVCVCVCVSVCGTFCLRQINKSILSSALHSAKLTLNFTRMAPHRNYTPSRPTTVPFLCLCLCQIAFSSICYTLSKGLVAQTLEQHSV